MTNPPPTPASPKGRARRTEKQWRHEDREITSTHTFWGSLVGLHGGVAGLAGILLGQSVFPAPLFLWIGAFSLVAMVLLAFLNHLSREADKKRAEYFRVTSQKTWPQGFDAESEDRRSKAAVDRYMRTQRPIEWVVMVLFLVNALILGWGAVCPKWWCQGI